MLKSSDEVLQDLKKKQYAPVYLLHGEESFYIDKITSYLESNAIPVAERGFNQTIMYGRDINMGNLLNQVRRFPMMADKQVVIVKEFQQMPDLAKNEASEMLDAYLSKAQPSTILLLAHKHKTLNKNTKLYKSFEKNAVVVESKKMYENQIPAWINQYLKTQNYTIEPKATQLLAEAIGAELARLSTELEKLCLNIPPQTPINEAHIEEYVGISKEYNVFELQNAISQRDRFKALQILLYWEANPKKQPLIPTLALLFGYFTKLLLASQEKDKSDNNLAKVLKINPYVIKEYKMAFQNYTQAHILYALELIYQADLQTKGIIAGGDNEAEILKELVFKVI